MDKLVSLTIRQVQKHYKDGSLKPSDIIRQSLKRAEQIKPLNAFVTLTSSSANDSAESCDRDVVNQLKNKPLFGIPIAVKDNFCTKGVRTTCASKMLENFIPTYDATVVFKLKNAGAIIIGKTNLDQFGMGSGTVDSMHGPTKNIWGSQFEAGCKDEADWRIAGGSSGGSAVAVAGGSCMAAIGSDTGGSTRNPAALCGLVGFKPTYGTVSRHGLIPLVNSLDVPGVLARNVDDCLRIYNCIAGPDKLDSTTIKDDLKLIKIPKINEISLKGIRIGIPQEYHCKNMSPEVLETWMIVADMLENEGARAKQVSMPYTNASIAVYHILNQCEVASNMARYDGLEYGLRPMDSKSTNEMYAKARSQGFNEVVRNRILAGNYFLLTKNYEKYFVKAMKIRRLITDDFNKVFNEKSPNCVDILLTPTTIGDAPLLSEFMKKNNRDQCALHDYCTQPANMAGVPALSIPIRLSKNNLPLSIQIMGPNLSEQTLFLIAKKIEELVNFPAIRLDI